MQHASAFLMKWLDIKKRYLESPKVTQKQTTYKPEDTNQKTQETHTPL